MVVMVTVVVRGDIVVCETELDTDSFGWAQSPFRGCGAVGREEDEAESLFFCVFVLLETCSTGVGPALDVP